MGRREYNLMSYNAVEELLTFFLFACVDQENGLGPVEELTWTSPE